MTKAHKSIFNWSGGKDSALALHEVLQDNSFNVERLFTTLSSTYRRVSMHGVRESLLDAQAISLGLPLQKLMLPEQPSMDDYNALMGTSMAGLKQEGFTHSIFGDIFLEDLKKYREEKLAQQGFSAHFPLWQRNTRALIHEFIDLGFKTVLVCIKADVLDKSFAGRVIDHDFLKDLPKEVDPCGERGEFHTFVYDGPIFKHPIPIRQGEIVYRTYDAPKSADGRQAAPMGFWFCELMEE